MHTSIVRRDAIHLTDTAEEIGERDVCADLGHNAQQQIATLKAGWMFVGKAFQDCNSACEGCDYHRITEEWHPYGEGHASASYGDCRLGEMAGDKPEQCLAYQAHTQEQREEA